MGQRVNGDVQCQFLAVVWADAFAFVAGIVRAKSAAQAVLAHDRHQVSIVKEAVQMDFARLIEASNMIDLVKRAIDLMVVGNWFDLLVGEDATEFAAPCLWKIRVGATTGSENEAAVCEIRAKVSKLFVAQNKVVMPVHE